MRQITKRFLHGQDYRAEIEKLAEEHNITAGVLLSAIGSFLPAKLRMAGGKVVKEWNEPLEIVSGTGTISTNGIHVHVSGSDINGNVVGGHLMYGCMVNFTAEIVILAFDDVTYKREPDEHTGYNELVIE